MAKSGVEKELEDAAKLLKRGTITQEEYEERRRSVLASGPSAASGGSKKGGIFKWGMFGCLGIFAAIGVLVVIVIIAISAAVSDSVGEEGADVRVALRAGSSGTIWPGSLDDKKTKVTILEIENPAESDNEFLSPDPGFKFVAFRVEIENVGTAEVSSLDWKLRDSKDGEYSLAFFSGLEPQLNQVYNLTPGGKASGWIAFEIPEDATIKWLRADPNPFIKNDLYFDAE